MLPKLPMSRWMLLLLLCLLGATPGTGAMGSARAADIEAAERDMQTAPKDVLEQVRAQLQDESISAPGRARWLALGSEVAYALAMPELAVGYAEEGLARPGLSAELRQRLAIAHALALDLVGRPKEAVDLLMTVVATLEKGHFDQQYLVDALVARATAYYTLGNFRAALADLLRVYPMAPQHGPRTIRADAAGALGNVYAALDDTSHAEQFFLEAIDYSTEAKTWVRASINEYNLASLYDRIENWPRAEEFFERSIAHSRLADDVQGIAYAEYGLAKVAFELGDLDKAERMYLESRPVFAAVGDTLPQANIEFGLAEIAHKRGEHREAIAHVEEALRLVEDVSELDLKQKLHALHAEAEFALEDYRNAYLSLQRSLESKQAWLEKRTNESLSEMRVRFDTERQEQQNALLLKQNQLNEVTLAEQQQRARVYIVSVIGLSTILGFLVFLAWRNKQVRKRLAAQALTDELTGVPNRRHIMSVLAAEVERSRRYRTPLAIAMLDLDHFKRINDRFGHAAGDQVLQAFAAAMAGSLRKTDCFGRVGGEEFLAVLPHTDGEVSAVVTERMRCATLALNCPKLLGQLQPSVSIGVAVLREDDASIEDLVKRADDAVYLAKQQGRNRVVPG